MSLWPEWCLSNEGGGGNRTFEAWGKLFLLKLPPKPYDSTVPNLSTLAVPPGESPQNAHVERGAWYVKILETCYESKFVCPTKVLSEMRLSEWIPFKTRANPQAQNPKLNRANLYENKIV